MNSRSPCHSWWLFHLSLFAFQTQACSKKLIANLPFHPKLSPNISAIRQWFFDIFTSQYCYKGLLCSLTVILWHLQCAATGTSRLDVTVDSSNLPFANDLVESLLSALVHASAASLSVWPNSLFLSGLSLDSLWHISPAQSHVSVWWLTSIKCSTDAEQPLYSRKSKVLFSSVRCSSGSMLKQHLSHCTVRPASTDFTLTQCLYRICFWSPQNVLQ